MHNISFILLDNILIIHMRVKTKTCKVGRPRSLGKPSSLGRPRVYKLEGQEYETKRPKVIGKSYK